MLYFVSVCLRGGQQEIQKDPPAPANKNLFTQIATLTITRYIGNAFHFIRRQRKIKSASTSESPLLQQR